MLFRPIIFFLAFCLGQGALAQSTRDAALLATPVYPIAGLDAAEVRWTPAGDADSAVLTTWTSADGLIGTYRFFQSTPEWLTPIPSAASEVEQEILQVVTIDTLRYLTAGYVRSGLARTGFQIPQRMVAVIVDKEVNEAMPSKIGRLGYDLILEGWITSTIVIEPGSTVAEVKGTIHNAFREWQEIQPGTPLHVFLIGDIPYPMSGGYSTEGAIPNPDFHPEHGGAWSSDAYYADLETSPGIDAEYQWTDDQVNITDPAVALREQNKNVPGDGKFDQSILPSDLELCVGRLDMRDLPAFGTSPSDRSREFELIERYLDKNHAYRTRQFVPPLRALIDDNFQLFARQNEERRIVEAFASSGWRSFAPIVGADSIMFGDWLQDSTNSRPALDTFPTLLSYACGGGGYEHCSFVINTEELSRIPIYSTFTLLFGSYFGDVNSSNNLMRAVLANEGWGLTCGWSGRPHWFLHPLANGNTIGECQRLTANNNGSYWGSTVEDLATGTFLPLRLGERNIHTMLLGDPTLTLQGPSIRDNLRVLDVGPDRRVTIQWSASSQHQTGPGTNVAYLVESRESLSTPRGYTTIDTVAPTSDPTITTTVQLPEGHNWIRVRPYFTAEGRLAPLPGRGSQLRRAITSVSESEVATEEQPTTWLVIDVTGRTVLRTFGEQRGVEAELRQSPLPSGVYLITDRRSTAKTVTFSR